MFSTVVLLIFEETTQLLELHHKHVVFFFPTFILSKLKDTYDFKKKGFVAKIAL